MSEINIKAELKKGFLMFRAFEHGMKLADEIDNIENTLQKKRKDLELLDGKLKSSETLLKDELEKISGEVGAARKREMSDLDEYKKQNNDTRADLNKKLDGIKSSIKTAETKAEAKQKEIDALDAEISSKKEDLAKFNKEIEETKNKFRSMF